MSRQLVLSDLADIVDCEHKTAPRCEPGEEFGFSVGTPALRGSGIDFAEAKPVDELTYRAWSRRAELTAGDIILAREAPVGGVGFVDGKRKVCLGQRTVLVRPDQTRLVPRYLFFALQGPDAQNWLADRSSGSTVTHVNVSDVRQLPLRHIPALDEQERIVRVLGGLADLVEADKALAQALDETFQASWRLAADRCKERSRFGEHASIVKGLSYKGTFLKDQGLPMLNLGSFGLDGSYKESGLKFYVEEQVQSRHLLRRGDLVIANTDLTHVRDILGRPLLVPYARATSTHHTFQVVVREGEAVKYWIYAGLREESVRQRLIAFATGTTVAALPNDALLSQELPWTDRRAMESWWSTAATLLTAKDELLEEARALACVRDELLPLLLSGAVAVAEVAA